MSPSFSWKAFSLPLLFTAFVLLHFYLTNYIEVNFSEFLFVALLLMGLIAAIELCLWKWLKDMDRVGLTTALGTFFFFSYERIVYAYHRFDQRVGAEIALVGTADPSHATRVACLWILAGLTLAGGVLLFRLKVNLKGLVRFGFLCSVGAILITGTFGAINLAGQLRPRLDLPRAGQAASSKPDIYVILLDAFGRPDMLERDYGVRTAPFVAALQKLGFKVFSESLANYPTTSYALACELNYAYIDQQSMGIPADYKSGYPLLSLVHSNRVTRFLREQGYEVVNIYGGVHFTRAFESCDVILHPIAPTAAFKLGEKTDDPLKMYLTDVYSVTANLAGLPAVTVPCGRTSGGLPIGVQLVAAAGQEQTLFVAASELESLMTPAG